MVQPPADVWPLAWRPPPGTSAAPTSRQALARSRPLRATAASSDFPPAADAAPATFVTSKDNEEGALEASGTDSLRANHDETVVVRAWIGVRIRHIVCDPRNEKHRTDIAAADQRFERPGREHSPLRGIKAGGPCGVGLLLNARRD